MSQQCENKYHRGKPDENHGKGGWWLREGEMWCPCCSGRYFQYCMEFYQTYANGEALHNYIDEQFRKATKPKGDD